MSGRIEIIRSNAELGRWRRAVAPSLVVGFVPTMGALHAGHARLLDRMGEASDLGVLSIFVNPTQFGPNEDLAKYPRTLDADLKLARAHGVDVVYAPAVEELYPPGFSTFVEESALSRPLCGPFRPGHFRGVATVVAKLFSLVRPDVAFFGLKDAQQFLVIQRMVRDLGLGVRVEGVPTVREPDGLAMSSRNRYLGVDERARAPLIYRALEAARAELFLGLRSPSPTDVGALAASVAAAGRARLEAAGFRIQYFEILGLHDLGAYACAKDMGPPPGLIAVAAHLGATRLIDNIFFDA